MEDKKEWVISPTGCHDCVLRKSLTCSLSDENVKENIYQKNFPWSCPLDKRDIIIRI